MRTIVIFLMVLISTTLFAVTKVGKLRERPRILIKYSRPDKAIEGSEELNNLRYSFETSVAQQISQEFPCAIINTYTEIELNIAADRGSKGLEADYTLDDWVPDLLDCDILIALASYKLGDKYYFSASAMDSKHATVRSKNVSTGSDSSIDYSELIKQIINDLVEMELCPYKGEITFSSNTTFKDSEERTGLPNQDCEFKATKKEENKIDQTWTFQKLKRYEGTANVNYTINNSKKETEHNSCRRCCKMENGVKIDIFEPGYVNSNSSTVKTETYSATKTASLEGLRLTGTNALTKITFNTLANNYTITVKAATEPAKWTTKSVTTNSGCPYDENFENELGAIMSKKCDRSFGPFPGSPYQKSLKQTVTKTTIAEDGKGQTIEKISFNLTR